MRRSFAALVALLPLSAQAADLIVPSEHRALSLTVYYDDLALVRDRRAADLPGGEQWLAWPETSPLMMAETALLSAPDLTVAEQTASTETISPAGLAAAFVGQPVTLVRPAASGGGETAVRARLLSAEGPVLEIDGKAEVAPPGRLVFDGVPAGLVVKPAYRARIDGPGGKRELALSYLTGGLKWRAEYRVQLNAEGDKADLTAWGVVTNATGVAFDRAKLALVAGQIHRAPPPQPQPRPVMPRLAAAPMAAMAGQEAQPEADPTVGSVVYGLPREVSLGPQQTTALSLLSLNGVPVQRQLVAEAQPDYVYLRPLPPEGGEVHPRTVIVLEGKGDLAPALPAGIARVFKPDASGVAQFLGEDSIGQKARGEAVRITVGHDPDVSLLRLQTEFRPPRQGEDITESAWRVALANHKATQVVVRVLDVLPVNGQVVEESLAHEQTDPRRVAWAVPVPAGGQAVLTYRVRAKAR